MYIEQRWWVKAKIPFDQLQYIEKFRLAGIIYMYTKFVFNLPNCHLSPCLE